MGPTGPGQCRAAFYLPASACAPAEPGSCSQLVIFNELIILLRGSILHPLGLVEVLPRSAVGMRFWWPSLRSAGSHGPSEVAGVKCAGSRMGESSQGPRGGPCGGAHQVSHHIVPSRERPCPSSLWEARPSPEMFSGVP